MREITASMQQPVNILFFLTETIIGTVIRHLNLYIIKLKKTAAI